MFHYSTIIKNGLVFDGRGNKPVKADIGITDDEIKKIGDLQTEAAYNVVDATGRCVAPGFIDITSHSDTHWTIFFFRAKKVWLARELPQSSAGIAVLLWRRFWAKPRLKK